MQMVTSNIALFFSSPRTRITQAAFQVCKKLLPDLWKEGQREESKVNRKKGEEERKKRGREEEEDIPARKDAEMQSVLAPLRVQNAHIPFQLQTRDATKNGTKRPLVGGDNYRGGLDKSSRTAGAEAQNNPSQQATATKLGALQTALF